MSKSYAGVVALTGVDLDVRAGEAVGLLGQNGAGKSTLVKIISGAEQPSAGSVEISGERVRLSSPAVARASGVHTIYQELSVVPQLTVAENVFLSDLPRRGPSVDWRELRRAARETLRDLGFEIDVTRRVRDLPLAQRQAIEIAKAVHSEAKIVLLDEPTAALPQPDAKKLFALLRRLKSEGVSIIYVSHRLDEVYDICDRITILRDGRQIATRPASSVHQDDAVRLMIGDKLVGGMLGQAASEKQPRINPRGAGFTAGAPALEVHALSDGALLENISLRVMPGEAVAVTGLVGSGQAELAACIFGGRPRSSGEVLVDGKPLAPGSPRRSIASGLGWLPEERKLQGLVLSMSVAENLTLASLRSVGMWGRLRRRLEQTLAETMAANLRIKTRGVAQRVGDLSGGNQQKVVFGKWLLARSRVLIVSEPTRGVDVGAKEEIYREMTAFLAGGGSMLVSSSEIDEALMCDRIYVLSRGRIVAELAHDDTDPDELVSFLR
ncbi:sugar ABC transporter ATP-binding protein [Cellulomonas fimi]|uniref:Sugar ABC transporter ATP-binding protein n=1 Tax=Cellulomonas fimi TaxID=1708 RepID=A0A7Y0M3A5_CELFI|nr:sugar ABC transporter ATP-binding protein [Cellulomonas fimi]NMR21697.1 sugar ABC transporter ATP-binding protein [Cellulomonas fimi]